MSTIQDVSAEQLARIFHHYHEALSQDRDCHGNGESCNSWERASQSERKLMLAAARLALLELATTPRNLVRGANITLSPERLSGAADSL